MPRHPARFCSLVLVLPLLTAGCSEVSPSNPFDPATPGSQQATGRVVGRLVLPSGFGAERLDDAQVTLRPQSDPAAVTATAEVDAEGAFALTDVVAGLYSVQVQVVGLSLAPIAIELRIGGDVDLGELLLEAPPEGLAAVLGRAQRAGAAEDGHQGIVIEALGTPYSAVTTSDGTFRLAVGAGEHTLRYSAPGYARETAPLGSALAPSEVRALEGVVVLTGSPGAVRGVVALEAGFEDAELLRTATLTLAHPGAPADDEATREAHPDGDGRFLFDTVAAGEWILTATLDSFRPVTVPLTVQVGASTTAPVITLFSTLTEERPELAGVFEGQVTRQGAPPEQHGGIRVQATGTPFVAQTADDGRYRLEVAGGRTYDLRFSAPGHTAHVEGERAVEAGEVVAVEPVVLVGQPGRVRGQVSIRPLETEEGEAPFDPRAFLPRVQVKLFHLDPSSPDFDPEDPLAVTQPSAAPVDEGLFTFDDVPGGQYLLTVELEGFQTQRTLVEVPLGDVALVPRIELRSNLSAPDVAPSVLIGDALLDCAGACDHGGTLVQVVGTPFTAVTSSTGAYRVELTAGPYQLRFSHAGFTPEVSAVGAIGDEETLQLEPVRLTHLPGAVAGDVLRGLPDGGAAPAEGATATLLQDDVVVASVPVDAAGGFTLGDLREGAYTVRLTRPFCAPRSAAVQVRPGAVSRVEPVVLPYLQGALAGRAALEGPPRGVPVTVVLDGQPDDAALPPLRRVLTAAPDDQAWAVAGLPVGAWRVRAVADGYRPFVGEPVVLAADAALAVDGALTPRSFSATAPAVTAGPAQVTVTADADLTHARVWVGAPTPPADLDFAPLPAGGVVAAPIDADGAWTVRAQLATVAAVDADPTNDLFAWRSPALDVPVVRDTTPPRVSLRAPGAYVRAAAVSVGVDCADALSGPDALTLEVEASDGARYAGPLQAAVPLALDAAPGARTVEATCVDAAGNAGEAVPVAFVLDGQPPAFTGFTLNGGGANAATNERAVGVQVQVADAHSGVAGLALSEDPALDCATAAYGAPPPADGVLGFTLSPGDGPRQLYACARDGAGNVSARQASNAVQLDTQPPEAGMLTLAGGADATANATVAIAVTGREAGLTVRLTGSLVGAAPLSFALATPPPTLTLDADDGDKLVTAVLEDAAGNRSTPFSDLVRLDTAAPLAGDVTLAGGQCTVTAQTVALNVAGTDADRMVVWTEAVDPARATCAGGAQADFDACPARPCDAPFSPAVQVTLGAAVGAHAVCWRFCDDAGNATPPAGRLVGLESFVDRPRPILNGLATADDRAQAPRASVSVVAFREDGQDDVLVVHGAGLAANTQALVGDLALPCAPVDAAGAPVDASACRANPDGGCVGGVCAASCAARCQANLPDTVMRNGGTYLVRVATPAPVAGGVGTSADVGFLTVVSPVPRLLSLDRRGVVQAIDAAGAPVPQTVVLTVTGEAFMDNVQFRLGDNYAEVLELTVDAEDARRATATIAVSTAGLYPLDAVDHAFAVGNPAPGGGEDAVPFGINPTAVRCRSDAPCVSNLRATRAPRAGGPGVEHAFDVTGAPGFGVLAWEGGTAAAVYDAEGRLLTRIEADATDRLVPLPFGGVARVVLEDARGDAPATRLDWARARGAADWGDEAEVVEVPIGVMAVAARAADVDADGDLDLLVLDGARDQVAVRLNDGAGSFVEGAPVRVGIAPTDLAVADLDGDGALDLAVSADAGISVHLGDGAAGFREGVVLPLDNAWKVRAADVDRDGLTDLVGAERIGRATLWTGRGDGTLRPASATARLPADDIALVDMDADGWLDVVGGGSLAGLHYTGVALNDRAGGFADVVVGPQGSANVALSVGDADDDGFADAWVIDRFNPVLQLMRGDGVGGLGDALIHDVRAEGTGAQRGALADVDADGTLDFVHGTNIRQPVRLEAGDGEGGLAPGVDVGRLPIGDPVDLRLVDLDGDGARDLLVADERRGSALIAWATPAFTVGGVAVDLSADDRFLEPQSVRDVAVGDVDGDGRPDVAVTSHAETYVRRGDDDTLRWLAAATASLSGVRVIDLDGDGDDDVIGFGPTGYVVSRSNGDGTFAGRIDRSVSTGEVVDFADLNDDGAPDLVGARGQRTVTVRLNNGAADFTSSRSFTAPRAIHRVVAADFDDDGAPDLLLVEQFGQTTLWTNDGAARFAQARAVGISASAGAFAGDVDGDGSPDAVGLRTSGNGAAATFTFGVAFNDGRGVFGAAVEVSYPAQAEAGALVDLNGDGLLDLVALDGEGRALVMFLNRDGRRFGAPTLLRLGAQASGLRVADVSGDRVADFLAWGGALPLTAWQGPGASVWSQRLQQPWRPLPGEDADVAEAHRTRFPVNCRPNGPRRDCRVHMAHQDVAHLAVRVRLEGVGVNQVRLTLEAPDGRVVRLSDLRDDLSGCAGAACRTWSASYPGRPAIDDLDALIGWQPAGDWTLRVEGAAATVDVVDFTVALRGAFARAAD